MNDVSSQSMSNGDEGSVGDPSTMNTYVKKLREKILFGLEIYPAVSPTMLHTFLGTSTSADVWKSILEELIIEGLVSRTEVQLTSPYDRVQTYTIIHRTNKPYVKPAYTLDSDSNNEDNALQSGK